MIDSSKKKNFAVTVSSVKGSKFWGIPGDLLTLGISSHLLNKSLIESFREDFDKIVDINCGLGHIY